MVAVLTKTDIVEQIGNCMSAGCMARVDSIMTRDVTYCGIHEVLRGVCNGTANRLAQRTHHFVNERISIQSGVFDLILRTACHEPRCGTRNALRAAD